MYEQLKRQLKRQLTYRDWVQFHMLYHVLVMKDDFNGSELKYCECLVAKEYRGEK